MPLDMLSPQLGTFHSKVLDRDRWAKRAWLNARARAARTGRPFSMTVEWLILNAPVVCPVLGIPLAYGPKGSQGPRSDSATIDRIENSLGYVPGNLLIVSGRANRKKGELSLADLRTLASTRFPGYDQDDFSRIVMFYSRL